MSDIKLTDEMRAWVPVWEVEDAIDRTDFDGFRTIAAKLRALAEAVCPEPERPLPWAQAILWDEIWRENGDGEPWATDANEGGEG